MGICCGTDIIEIKRIEEMVEKQNIVFLERVYTQQEIDYCISRRSSKFQCLAARFCAKEAVVKALGTGISKNIEFKDIEILNHENGKPYVVLHKSAKSIFEGLGLTTIDISLSHCKEFATAMCVMM